MTSYRMVIELQSVETMGEIKTVEVFHLSSRLGTLERKRDEFNFFERLCGAWKQRD